MTEFFSKFVDLLNLNLCFFQSEANFLNKENKAHHRPAANDQK